MILKWLRNRKALRQVEEERQRLLEEVEKEKRIKALGVVSEELKQTLIKAGIHPFNRVNRIEDEYVMMYGILNGRIVKATMNARGRFFIEYTKMP